MTEYSPDRFYTQATDNKGHRSVTRVSFPPYMVAEVEALAASSNYSHYRTAQDVIRDAVFHRLQWLTDNGVYDFSDVLATWQVQMLVEQEKERVKLAKKILSDINYIRLHARTDGDRVRLRTLIIAALNADIPEDVRSELLRLNDSDI